MSFVFAMVVIHGLIGDILYLQSSDLYPKHFISIERVNVNVLFVLRRLA